MRDDQAEYRIGELAGIAGLTVRTLHHYDEIGLLSPRARTGAGHRLYGPDEVRRLYRIVALRQLGLPLPEIAAFMESNGTDPRAVIHRHLERLDEQSRLQERLRVRLEKILDALDGAGEPSTEEFLDALEVMSRMERYYTPEQLDRLEQRRRELGEDAIKRAEQEWAEVIEAVEAERERGTDPSDPKVQALARRWRELIEAFTGGDPGIRSSLQRMYEQEGVENASRGMVTPETMAYVSLAMGPEGA